jgi:hypothetical protein
MQINLDLIQSKLQNLKINEKTGTVEENKTCIHLKNLISNS